MGSLNEEPKRSAPKPRGSDLKHWTLKHEILSRDIFIMSLSFLSHVLSSRSRLPLNSFLLFSCFVRIY